MGKTLSIVIANYNYGRFLDAAIRSVVTQDGFEECELIVVDGGSTDESVEIIKKYADKISWWCSEKDKGQSDAFNKGFAKARGKYLTWVNADDVMPTGCLKKIVKELREHPNCEWFTGNFFRFTEDGRVIAIGWGPHYYPKCLQTIHAAVAVFGPSTFFSKDLFSRVGGMRVDQNFMMDTDLWIRFILAGIKQRRINCFCWAFRMHIDSKTAEFDDHKLPPEQRARFERERHAALVRTGYHASRWLHRLFLAWRLLDGSIFRGFWLRKTFTKYEV